MTTISRTHQTVKLPDAPSLTSATPGPVTPSGAVQPISTPRQPISSLRVAGFLPNLMTFPLHMSLGAVDETTVIPGSTVTDKGGFTDAHKLLDHVFQVDNLSETKLDLQRCGAAVAFAELALRGPAALQNRLQAIVRTLGAKDAPSYLRPYVEPLRSIDVVKQGHLTLKQAHLIIEALYVAGKYPNVGETGMTLQAVARAVGLPSADIVARERFGIIEALVKPGQRVAVSIQDGPVGHIMVVERLGPNAWFKYDSSAADKSERDGLPINATSRLTTFEMKEYIREYQGRDALGDGFWLKQ